ncbi:MAG: site-specific DNA-methyltransferase, partial [Sphingomonadales bacterium]|nr:site-specific DNA-methyltransferase [Sphingomonadales bacterium]
MYRTEWIWQKVKAKNYVQASNHPLKYHENIVVFSKKKVNYYPLMEKGKPYLKVQRKGNKDGAYLKDTRESGFVTKNEGTRFPSTIIY